MKAKLETLSVSVLREFAKDKNIKNISAMRKSELIEAIIAAAEGEEKNEPAEVASVVAEDEADVQNNHKTSEYSHQKSEQYVKEEHKENYHAQPQRGQEQPKQEQDMPMADVFLRFCQKVMDL